MKTYRMIVIVLGMLPLVACGMSSANIKVAVVKSWGSVPVFTELNDNWAAYGTVPITIDTSLMNVSSFTYDDLVNTGADVLWISDPSGIGWHYSSVEVDAVAQYAGEGHSVLGTYRVFNGVNGNSELAPVFGLRQDIEYNTSPISAGQVFNIIVEHPIFNEISDPYISGGWPYAQVPLNDLKWDPVDLGTAQLLAQTDDGRGVITWYKTESYRAIFVSEMVEYYGNSIDTQFLYNALTIPEPGTILLFGLGGLALLRKRRTVAREMN